MKNDPPGPTAEPEPPAKFRDDEVAFVARPRHPLEVRERFGLLDLVLEVLDPSAISLDRLRIEGDVAASGVRSKPIAHRITGRRSGPFGETAWTLYELERMDFSPRHRQERREIADTARISQPELPRTETDRPVFPVPLPAAVQAAARCDR